MVLIFHFRLIGLEIEDLVSGTKENTQYLDRRYPFTII